MLIQTDFMTPNDEAMFHRWPVSLSKNTVRIVKACVENNLAKSRHVTSHQKRDDSVGLFRRDSIIVGDLLGEGGFSQVYEIKSFSTTLDDSTLTQPQQLARSFYKETATRSTFGESRYVIKHLRPSLMSDPRRFQRAATDLVMEAGFLASFDHPNIIKLRGIAIDGIDSLLNGRHDGYFMIVDRLHETLDERIGRWRHEENRHDTSTGIIRQCPDPIGSDTYSERLRCAFQMASALHYLHQRDVIFRDFKPSNIGFDAHGDVKLFDFGLSRELPSLLGGKTNSVSTMYEMSGNVGTIRYMAPEVAMQRPYNLQADVYSWALVTWQVMTLQKPYDGYSRRAHVALVCERAERPTLHHGALSHTDLAKLLQQCWAHRSSARPTMKIVCGRLQQIIQTGHNDQHQPEQQSHHRRSLSDWIRRQTAFVFEFPVGFGMDVKPESCVDATLSTANSTSIG